MFFLSFFLDLCESERARCKRRISIWGVKRKTGSNVDIDPHSLGVWKYRRGGEIVLLLRPHGVRDED